MNICFQFAGEKHNNCFSGLNFPGGVRAAQHLRPHCKTSLHQNFSLLVFSFIFKTNKNPISQRGGCEEGEGERLIGLSGSAVASHHHTGHVVGQGADLRSFSCLPVFVPVAPAESRRISIRSAIYRKKRSMQCVSSRTSFSRRIPVCSSTSA